MKTIRKNNLDLNLDLDLTGSKNPDLIHPIFAGLRAIGVVTLILTYFILTLPFYPLLKMKPLWTKKHILGPILQVLGITLLKIMNVKVEKSGNFNVKPGTVIACNHLNAYLDMMVIWSVTKGSFLSTVEVQAMPLFGQIAELAGCIFIDRRTRENLPEEIQKVTEQCETGINLIFFPEGKCHDGTDLLRFKRPFFTPATSREVDIQLVTMNYHTVSGRPVTRHNKHMVLWYRQQKIIKHLWKMLQFRSVEVSATGSVLKADNYTKNKDIHVADQAHEIIKAQFNPIQ